MDEKARAILAQLGITGQNVTKLPTGEFTGGGFVGPLVAAHLYRINVEGEEQQIDGIAAASPMGDWGYAYYFREQDKADAAAKAAQLKYARSSAVHRIEVPTRSVITTPETMAKLLGQGESRGFGEIISAETQVRTTSSKRYRHEWQLISFPSMVSAAARLFGYDAEPFDISELRGQDTAVFTDELFSRLCGSPDAKRGDEDFYTESAYWKQRAELWKALGEDDPAKCHTKEMGGKYATESDALDACFTLALSSFTAPIYGRLRLVADPRVDAVFGDDARRQSLGVITDLWATEAEAREAAGQENGQEAAPSSTPPIPQDYEEAGFNAATFGEEIRRTAGKAVPLAARELGVDASVVGQWREALAL